MLAFQLSSLQVAVTQQTMKATTFVSRQEMLLVCLRTEEKEINQPEEAAVNQQRA